MQFRKAEAVVWLIASLSILAGYLAGDLEQKTLFYISTLLLAGISFFGILLIYKDLRLPVGYVYPVGIYLLLIVLMGVMSGGLSMSYLMLFFTVTLFCFSCYAHLGIERLLLVTNVIYAVYLFLSVLLYFEFLPPSKELNMFEYDAPSFLGGSFRTFVGFYGSTATVDSYSIIVALINLLFNKSAFWRWVFFLLGLCAAAATLRFTPFVALGGAIVISICIGFIKNQFVRNYIIIGLTIMCFLSPLIFLALFGIFGLDSLVTLDAITSGRASIWVAMLPNFFVSQPMVNILLGSVNIDSTAVDLGFSDGHLVGNPHNNYLSFLLRYGFVGWLALLIAFSKVLCRLTKTSYLLVATLLMLTAVTNSETFGIYFPIYLIWIGTLYAASNKIKNTID